MNTEVTLSDHSIARYLERTGVINKYKNKITKIVEKGYKVRPKNNLKKLLNHKCQPAEYYKFQQFVAVVVNNKIITIMNYSGKKWERI